MMLPSSTPVKAINERDADYYALPQKVRCTCYISDWDAITASGVPVNEGIAAGRKEWCQEGYKAILYDEDMNYIGTFDFADTGAGIDTDGDGKGDSIKNGTSIDIYRDYIEGCQEWTKKYGDYVYMQIIKGKG